MAALLRRRRAARDRPGGGGHSGTGGANAAGLAAEMASQYGGDKMVTWATIWLTVVTLVACEIIPKALAVSQAESVARFMVPIINLLAIAVFPIGKLMQVSQHMPPSADADCTVCVTCRWHAL